MGGGASRQSYEEYVNKRRSKELLFYEGNTNLQSNKPKWGRRLSIPSLNNTGGSVRSSIESYPKRTIITSKSLAISKTNTTTPSNKQRKKAGFLSSPLSEDDDIVNIDPIQGDQDEAHNSSGNLQPQRNTQSENTLAVLQPKYALVRRKSKSSDATRTAIKKL